jgi:hypothetical protein
MDVILGIIILAAIGFLFLAPLAGAFDLISRFSKPTLYPHFVLNLLFLVWAVYDVLFTYHYPHGPNTILIALPGFIAFFMFYIFALPRLNPSFSVTSKKIRVGAAVVNSLTLIGITLKP